MTLNNMVLVQTYFDFLEVKLAAQMFGNTKSFLSFTIKSLLINASLVSISSISSIYKMRAREIESLDVLIVITKFN